MRAHARTTTPTGWQRGDTIQVRSGNAIQIRADHKTDPTQPLPASPARALPIPCKAVRQARDAARHRRKLPVDMSVTNYSWKNKDKVRGKHALSGLLPSHIGQSLIEDEKKPVVGKPKSPHSPHLFEDSQRTDEEEDGEEFLDAADNEHRHTKRGPPEAVVRIGYVMKYRSAEVFVHVFLSVTQIQYFPHNDNSTICIFTCCSCNPI